MIGQHTRLHFDGDTGHFLCSLRERGKQFTQLAALCRVSHQQQGSTMKKLIAAILAVVAIQAQLVHGIQMASPKSNRIVKTCTEQEGEASDAACQAFVQGVADVTAFYSAAQQMTAPFCVPVETSPEQLLGVYRAYLENHHALRQLSAAAQAVAALKEAFPCGATKSS